MYSNKKNTPYSSQYTQTSHSARLPLILFSVTSKRDLVFPSLVDYPSFKLWRRVYGEGPVAENCPAFQRNFSNRWEAFETVTKDWLSFENKVPPTVRPWPPSSQPLPWVPRTTLSVPTPWAQFSSGRWDVLCFSSLIAPTINFSYL